jgi:hypothetical protein
MVTTSIGRRYNYDDVLFKVTNSEFYFAAVHLTYYSKREEKPNQVRLRVLALAMQTLI